ncbi:MAG: hypothetical protein V2I33_05675 [Kangiellaceae bacterium]|jgi:hypothetical protein|nr:hypothetical protein [Kangiellaceae bacterium]
MSPLDLASLDIKNYSSDRKHQRLIKTLQLIIDKKATLNQNETQALFRIMAFAYENADDDVLERGLRAVILSSMEPTKLIGRLIDMIEWRPVDGDFYEPKEWRGDVNIAITTALNVNVLCRSLEKK